MAQYITPVYDAATLYDELRIVYITDTEVIYWLYPEDPTYPINRGYSGETMAEIFAKMRNAGWRIINHKAVS